MLNGSLFLPFLSPINRAAQERAARREHERQRDEVRASAERERENRTFEIAFFIRSLSFRRSFSQPPPFPPFPLFLSLCFSPSVPLSLFLSLSLSLSSSQQEALARQRQHSEAAARVKAAQAALGPGSRLQRGTPFLCDVRFSAALPEVPCDPKLVLEPPADPAALSRFRLTSLERGPIRDVALGEDAAGAAAAAPSGAGAGRGRRRAAVGSLAGGLCISLLTPESYEFARRAPARGLCAEDATLLVNAERALATARAAEAKGPAAAAAGAPASAPAAAAAAAAPLLPALPARPLSRGPRGEEKELAWLMRTSYVTAAGGSRAGTGRGGGVLAAEQEQQGGGGGGQGRGQAPPLDREALLAAIDATFAAARELDGRAPRHPTRPDELRAVAVRPVLPHARMAGNHHVLLTLDKDPLADCVPAAALAKAAAKASAGNGGGDAKPRLTPQEEDYLLSRAVTKSYKAARDPERPGEEPEKFLGYMVPAEIPKGLFGGEGGGDGNGNDAARRDGAGDPSTSSASSLRSLPFSGEYEWVREFMFRIEKGEAAAGAAAGAAKKRSYLLDLSSSPPSSKKRNASGLDAEPVRIVDLDTRLVAFSQRLSTPVNRPSSIRIVSRGRTEAEEAAARARRAAVVGGGSG